MKRIIVELDGGEYQRLRELALDQDRDAHQHARFLLRQALAIPPELATVTAGVVRLPEHESMKGTTSSQSRMERP